MLRPSYWLLRSVTMLVVLPASVLAEDGAKPDPLVQAIAAALDSTQTPTAAISTEQTLALDETVDVLKTLLQETRHSNNQLTAQLEQLQLNNPVCTCSAQEHWLHMQRLLDELSMPSSEVALLHAQMNSLEVKINTLEERLVVQLEQVLQESLADHLPERPEVGFVALPTNPQDLSPQLKQAMREWYEWALPKAEVGNEYSVRFVRTLPHSIDEFLRAGPLDPDFAEVHNVFLPGGYFQQVRVKRGDHGGTLFAIWHELSWDE